MTVWNVLVPVVATVNGNTEQEAIARLCKALDDAGFAVHEGSDASGIYDAFRSDDQSPLAIAEAI
jgi:hypothetical protein